MNDDYIILRDEDGKAYIAHAGWLDNAKNAAQQVANKAKGVGRGIRQNHKYILKVNENGRTRYFYKQEEVKAYYEAKKRGIKNAAEYAQNAVKNKASKVADAVKNVANKATGATANETAETAKKNADDAHRWAKMTERVHKENLASFKQNPTEANLAKAKQSGQAVTRANQNEKNARKEADKAQDIADQHPVNKAKTAFDQAKKSADNAVATAKNNYERMKSEFRDRAEQAGNAAKSAASKVADKARDIAGYDERERRDAASDYAWDLASKGKLSEAALDQQRETEKQYRKTPLGMIDTARDKIGLTARKAMKDLEAERDGANISNDPSGVRKFNADSMARFAKATYQETPLGKLETFAADPRTAVKESVQGMINNARSSTAKAVNEAWDKIPKNADGTVNPFDKNFQSTYNDWKAKKDKYDSSLAGRAKDAAEKVTDSVQDMIDKAKKTARDAAASAQSTIDNATGNNYRKRAQEANQAAENAINQRARTSDQLENQRSKYGSKENDSDYIYGDSEGYYYQTKEQRDRAESLISKRDRYDADIVNNNRASKVNDSMYADSKAGKINDILGRSNVSTSERANSKATEVQNKWDRQEAESKLIGGRIDPNTNVSKEYVYSRASNSGMAGQVRQVMQLEEAMRDAERAYDRLDNESSKPQSSSRAARTKMLDAQKAYNEAYEDLIADINKQYDRDLAAYEKQYGKYNR